MRDRSGFRALAVGVALAMMASCVTTKLPPISSVGSEFEPLKDERRLWERARDEEEKLLANAALYRDPLLVDYLEELAGRLNTPGMAANRELSYRVRVIEDPTLNAFAYPHGALFVHTGLLARMQNEDQLATVLGHEMTHVENRHMVRYLRSARNKQIGFSVAAIAAAVILAGEEGEAYKEGKYGKAARIDVLGDLLIGLGLQLAVLASVNGYGRELEREADQGAFEKLAAAGYDVAQAAEVYGALQEEHGDSGRAEAFFFGSHPQLAARIENSRLWVEEHPGVAQPVRHDQSEFQRRIRPVIRDDARLNIEAGRLELAEHELQRVVHAMPEDPATHLLVARLELARAEQEKDPAVRRTILDRAANSLRESIRLDPERPAPHLELGLLAYRDDEFRTACVQLRHYAELAPDADDVQRIRDYVLELELDGHCP